jgi:hypothetical protein
MSSPLGLGLNVSESFVRGTANYRYDTVNQKWKGSNNQNYQQSLFNDGSSLAYFPNNINPNIGNNLERDISATNPNPHSGDGSSIQSLSNNINADNIYDVRTQAIIDWSQKQSNAMMLYAKDFAYLRYLGVYPNNRLIVCKKFGSGVDNDLSKVNINPISTILSWSPPGAEFFKISFGEKWTDAEATFKEILEEVGGDFGSKGFGAAAAGGFGALSMPGFTEIFQRQVLRNLGLIDDVGAEIIPSGNPNLIKIAKRRDTVEDGRPGSGLDYKISITVKAEYEQKFIGGLDPTKAFYDIISNISSFGTQDAVFYLNGAGATGLSFSNYINKLKNNPKGAITDLLNSVINGLKSVVTTIIKALGNGSDQQATSSSTTVDASLVTKLLDEALSLITGIVKKYEIRLLGVVNTLTGNPSGPWHITIGNPRRPIYTSGDMYLDGTISLTLGETLAFNDLPSRITAEFTLTNAIPLGLTEIMSRFMQGQGRSYISGPQSWIDTKNSSDFNINNITNSTASAIISVTASPAQYGGMAQGGSQADGSNNSGPGTQSNQTFATGTGQESSINQSADPNVVRNPSTITDPPNIATNDVKPDPSLPQPGVPAITSSGPQTQPGITPLTSTPGSQPLSNSQISSASNDTLVARQSAISNQVSTLPPTVQDSNGKNVANPQVTQLNTEQSSISSELDNRETTGTYNPSNPTNTFTPSTINNNSGQGNFAV